MTTKFSQFTSQGTFAGTDELVGLSGSTNSRWTGAVVADYVASVGVIQSATVTLTAADLAVLDSVPFELVPAPGAGKILSPILANWVWLANGGIYPQAQTGAIDVSYDDNNGNFAFASPAFPLSAGTASADSFAASFQINAGGGIISGAYSNTNIATQVSDSLQVPGAISASDVADGGADWVNGDTFTVDGGLGTLATGTITNAVAGVVQAGGYTLDTTPNGYLIANGVATTATSGIGTGLTIDITALDYSENPMTLTVKTLYSVMDV